MTSQIPSNQTTPNEKPEPLLEETTSSSPGTGRGEEKGPLFEIHPVAQLFPPLSEEELRDLAEDIKEHGQKVPIAVWRGFIIDGRNRQKACEMADVEPWYEEEDLEDDWEVARFVVSANLKRRHLTESQRALLGARLEEMFAPEAQQRMYSGKKDPEANLPQGTRAPQARDLAAREVGVSPRSVQTAKTVLQQGAPALIEAVEAGKVSVSTAAALSQAPKEKQSELVARGKKEILQAAKAIRRAEGEKRRRERTEHLAKLSTSSARDLGSLGRFPVLYADPPWRYTQHRESSRSVENHYPTMEVEEICALGVDQLACEDAVLFLWATAPCSRRRFGCLSPGDLTTRPAGSGTKSTPAWATGEGSSTSWS